MIAAGCTRPKSHCRVHEYVHVILESSRVRYDRYEYCLYPIRRIHVHCLYSCKKTVKMTLIKADVVAAIDFRDRRQEQSEGVPYDGV